MHLLYDIDIVNMLGTNQHQENPSESRIDKMRKFLSSPLMRKKPTALQLKTFGTPLDTLLQRDSSVHSVPFIVTRLCQYIKQMGLSQEGLFRISGNARSVERLKASFDRTGDAPLETEGDVPSAAALLKLFLRELPDPIIPMSMHCQFLNAVKDKDKSECISCLTDLVDKLPAVNYCILSYLSCFLKQVSDLEEENRMSASSLGIVFGPNLFRVTEDFVGLKEQSLTNQIVTYFITNYQDIFKKEPHFSETDDILPASISNSSHQVPAMVSSWPETKACSSAMLSSWSLGPISIPMHSSDDTYLPLCPVSYSIEQASSTPFALCKQDELDFPSVSYSDFSEKSINEEFSVHQSEISKNPTFERFSPTSGLSSNLKSQSYNESSQSNSFSEIEAELSYAFKECSLASDSTSFNNQHHFTSAHKKSFDGNGYAESKEYSLDVGEISLQIPDHLPKSVSDEVEDMLMEDSHKIYPRGRRRHIKHQKKQGFDIEERRSRSELRSNSRFENEDECNGNASYLTLSSKLDPHHNSTGTMDESSSDLRHSWPAFHKYREDDIALSPLPQPLVMTHGSEASVSPSAFRNYLSHRNLHLDPNLPPSPPVEQEDLITVNSLEDSTSSAKQLTKKVHALKKKIKLFEENFEKLYGYKPSNTDKCSNIAVKKMLAELNKAKQDMKQLKQEPALWSDDETSLNKSSRGTNTYCSQGLFAITPVGAGTRSIEDSVNEAMEYLVRHRKSEKRPEALEEMSRDQLVAEKVLVQKVLLNFESMHGRPSSKVHRELVRPLYDRYRSTKRLIARINSSKDPAELQPILEHETMDFPLSDQVKEAEINQDIKQSEKNVKASQSPQYEAKSSNNTLPPHINFHELSLSELTEELNRVREEKRKIRKMLRDFEEQFKKENRRKAQREDKRCMESFYTEYKNSKAKLKLLEALVAKHEQTS